MVSRTYSAQEVCLDEMVDEMLDNLQSGKNVDIDRMIIQHPELGDQLRKMHATLKVLIPLDHSVGENLSESEDETEVTGKTLGDFRIGRRGDLCQTAFGKPGTQATTGQD